MGSDQDISVHTGGISSYICMAPEGWWQIDFLNNKQSSEIYSSVKMSCHTGSMITDFLCCLISVNLVLYMIISLSPPNCETTDLL